MTEIEDGSALDISRPRRVPSLRLTGDTAFADVQASPAVTLGTLIAAAWRRRDVFVGAFIVTLAAAAGIIFSLTPRYEADALLIVDPRQTSAESLQPSVATQTTLSDLNFVRSQMQILTSDGLAGEVVTDLHLQDDPNFLPKRSFVSRLLDNISGTGGARTAASTDQRIEAAIQIYKERFGAFSDGKSFIIAASFTADNPVFARRILERHLDLFQAGQVAAKRAATARLEHWFAGELQALQSNLLAAEARQQAFRENNGIVRASGETVPSRQVAEITSQLTTARSDLARKEARYAELSGSAQSGGGADTQALSSDLLQKLREQEAIAARVAAQMEQTSGANYPPLASARAGLADLQGRIAAEMGRLKASAARDVTIAAAHVRMLEQTMNASNQELDATSKDELTAVQLDRDIEVDRHLYDDLLLRSKQASIQDQLETPDTRIASAPTLPLVPAFPRKGMLMAVATMAAGLIGIAAAFLVESLGGRKAFALETIASRCGVAGLAIIPKLGKKEMGLVGRPEATSHLGVALHRLRNSIAFRCGSQTPKVTVFASALPGDGKTLLSTLYARSLASSGTRVLLIDADLRHRGLTKSTAAQANLGLTEHLGGKTLEECVVRDVVEGVDVLPAGSAGDDPSVLFNAGRVELLLAEAAKTYTAIIVDTAPVGVVDDALHFIARADATVMVARWNSTPLAFISRAVERIGLAGGKLVGLALTAVDMRKYRSQSETPSDFVRYQSYYLTNG